MALQNEFVKSRNQLTRVQDYNNRIVEASGSLLDLIANFPKDYTESYMDSLLRDYGYFLSFDPSNSALEAAISSGDIHLIKSDSLIDLLFAWPSMITDSKEEENQARQLLFEQKKELLFRYTRELDIWTNDQSIFSSDYEGLLKNPDFENNVMFRRGIVMELVREQNAILEVNDLILSLIAKEVN
jgi:hypothetical protein